MNELVEQAAVNLAAVDDCRLRFLSEYRKLVRATIQTIREPTQEMLDAAEREAGIGPRTARAVYQAMLEVAVNGK